MTNTNLLTTFNQVVSFDLYPADILGAHYEDVKVKAVLDADTARTWIDPEAQHANVYPTLPEGTPNDPQAYPYIKFQQANGAIMVLGLPWIRPDTVRSVEKGQLTIQIADVTYEDQQVITRAIAANGYRVSHVQMT